MLTKLYKIFFILFLFTSVNFIYSQDNFEGEVKFNISGEGHTLPMDYFIKDKNMRIVTGNESQNMIFIHSDGKSLILMPSQKMYMDLDNSMFSKMKEMMNKKGDEDKEMTKEDFEKSKTGKTKDILGYECSQWIFKEDGEDSEVEAWITDELGNFMMMESPMGQGFSPSWSGDFKDKGLFPLLVITRDKDGKETSRFEATEVDKKSLSNDLFEVPSDYKEMKIPGM